MSSDAPAPGTGEPVRPAETGYAGSRAALIATVGAAFAAALAAGLCRIADLDFWWHLEIGDQIAATGSIPRVDTLSYTARGHEYIDHEWLFQLLQHALYAAGGSAAIAVAKSLVIGLTLAIAGSYALRRGAGVIATLGLLFLAVAGGITRFIERPEMFTMFFAVATYVLLDEYARSGNKRLLIAIPIIAALWANVHAAVIVGIVIQGLFAVALLLEDRRRSGPVALTAFASVVASLINPFGYRVLTVPFELTRIIESGVVNNDEWQRPQFVKNPFFFVAAAIVAVCLVRMVRDKRWRAVGVAIFLGYIALRYVRNVGIFSVFVPLLIAPELAACANRVRRAVFVLGAGALFFVLTWYYPFERGFGAASYFPDRIAGYVEQRNLQGNMLNSYDFGGYLAWSLLPERPIFIDGRNEVFLPLMQRLGTARSDSRAWNALLRDYDIQYALLQYVDEPDQVTTVAADGSAATSMVPFTVTRFPRSRWALVYFDDDGMVFVRRDGANGHVLADEYASLYPEGWGYQQHLVENGSVNRDAAITELRRKLSEDPHSQRAQFLLASITQKR